MAKINTNVWDTQLEAIKEFTDREDPQEAFERKFRVLYEDWKSDYYVLCYYGIGGIGKTSFINKLCRVIRGVEGNELRLIDKIDCDYIRYDFEAKTSGTDKESILYSFRNQLLEVNKNFRFFKFDYALYSYAQKTGKNVEKDEAVKSLLERIPWLDMVFSTVGLIPGVSFATSAFQAFDKFSNILKGEIGKHIDKKRFHEHLKEVDDMEPPEILNKLHEYFIFDMLYNMQQIASKPIIVFIDTYEKYIDTLNREISMITEDHWFRKGSKSIIRNIPGVLWVITGREKLYWREDDVWDEQMIDSPLSKMTEEEKENLAKSELEQHLLGDLSIKDATYFLRKAGIKNTTLCTQLYELTNGTPLFLDVCVDTYNELCERNIVPDIEMFGEDLTQLISRYLSNMNEANREMTYFLACLGVWDDESVKEIATMATTLRWYRYAKYEDFINHSFIVKNPDDSYYMHETVRNAALKNADKEIVEEISKIHLLVVKKNVETSMAIDSNIALAEYIRVLTENNYSYEEIYENMELIGEQVVYLRNAGNYDLLYTLTKKVFLAVTNSYPNTAADYIIRGIYGYVLCMKGLVKEALEVVKQISFDNDNCKMYVTEWLRIEELLAIIYGFNGMYHKSLELRRDIWKLRKEILGGEHPDTLDAMNNLAISYDDMGEYHKSLELKKVVLEMRKRISGEEHPDTFVAINNLVSSYIQVGEYQKAMEIGEEALEIIQKILGEEHPLSINMLINILSSCDKVGEYQKAMEIGKKVLETSRKILGEEHPDTLKAMNNLAVVYQNIGEYQKSLELTKEVLEKRKLILGEEHLDTLRVMSNLVSSYIQVGEYQKVMEIGEKALETSQRILGEEHPDTLKAMLNLAVVYQKIGEYQKAMEIGEKALETSRKILGEEHPNTLTAMNNLASYYNNVGEYNKSLELRKEVLKKRKLVLGEEHPNTFTTMLCVASSYDYLGEYQKSLMLYENMLKINKETGGKVGSSNIIDIEQAVIRLRSKLDKNNN